MRRIQLVLLLLLLVVLQSTYCTKIIEQVYPPSHSELTLEEYTTTNNNSIVYSVGINIKFSSNVELSESSIGYIVLRDLTTRSHLIVLQSEINLLDNSLSILFNATEYGMLTLSFKYILIVLGDGSISNVVLFVNSAITTQDGYISAAVYSIGDSNIIESCSTPSDNRAILNEVEFDSTTPEPPQIKNMFISDVSNSVEVTVTLSTGLESLLSISGSISNTETNELYQIAPITISFSSSGEAVNLLASKYETLYSQREIITGGIGPIAPEYQIQYSSEDELQKWIDLVDQQSNIDMECTYIHITLCILII
jgi:hypothetical protein